MATKKNAAPQKKPAALTPDEQVNHGDYAVVVDGDHAGRYGVVVAGVNDDGNVTLRTRDSANEYLVLAQSALRPSEPGLR